MTDSGQGINSSEGDCRYVRSWKCQVSVGELYRWILAKLSDKDIKRALHKYRDLMPRQSDWNRKLTQATSVPELGFRYLYRCGQIDESNHRTMQKMLKYIDRQDLLPYFDTILYNTNYANCSLEELQKVLLDKVDVFLELSSMLSEAEVHADAPYEVRQSQPIDQSRITRASLKRRAKSGDILGSHRLAVAKRIRYISDPSPNTLYSTRTQDGQSAVQACMRVRSGLLANALSGPVVHTVLSTSLINIFAALCTTMPHVLEGRHQLTSSAAGDLIHSLSSVSSLLAGMPHLLGLQPGSNLLLSPSPPLRMHQPRQQPFLNNWFEHRQHQQQPAGMQPPVRPPNHLPGEAAPRAPLPPHNQLDQNARPDHQAPNRPPAPLGMQPPPPPLLPPPPAHNEHQRHQAPGRVMPLGLLAANRQGGGGAVPRFAAFPHPPPPAHAQDNNNNQAAAHPPVGMANPPGQQAQAPPPPPMQLKQIVLSAGGIGITDSPKESLIQYYCSMKMRVTVDLGPSTRIVPSIRAGEQELFDQQIDRFVQASTALRARSCGEFICHMRFNRLHHLETFWRDYQSGLLRKVLMDMLLCPSNRSFFGRSPGIPVDPASVANPQQQQQQQPARPEQQPQPVPRPDNVAADPDASATFQWPFLTSTRWGVETGGSSEAAAANSPGFELPSLASLAEALAQLRQDHSRSNSSRFELNLFVSRRDYENGRCLLMRNLRAIPSLKCLMAVSDFLSIGPQPSTSGSSGPSCGLQLSSEKTAATS